MSTDRLTELRQSLAASPGNPQLLYLLGAELAQQGQFDDATAMLTSAVAIAPSLHTARLQLGLLHLTMGRTEQALALLANLDTLPDDDPLKHFKRGLQALAADEIDACVAELRRGIALNKTNAALNDDMARILARIDEIKSAPLEAPQPAVDTERPKSSPAATRTDFSLYKTLEDT